MEKWLISCGKVIYAFDELKRMFLFVSLINGAGNSSYTCVISNGGTISNRRSYFLSMPILEHMFDSEHMF